MSFKVFPLDPPLESEPGMKRCAHPVFSGVESGKEGEEGGRVVLEVDDLVVVLLASSRRLMGANNHPKMKNGTRRITGTLVLKRAGNLSAANLVDWVREGGFEML
jgi:hypothetical protein